MSASSESDSEVTFGSRCQPRTRRGLAKQHASDCQSSVDVSPSSENSIYTNQVFRLNSLAAKRVQHKEVYKKPLSEDFKKKTTEQESDGKSTVSSCNPNVPSKIDEISPVVKDPTPPSTPERVVRQKGKRMKKGVKAAMNALQKMKKKMRESDDDVMIIDNDPCQATDSHSFAIKIRLPSGVKKFQIKPGESFARVFSAIAATEEVDENDIFMFFNDSTVHIYDSPNALGITVADILDCHVHTSRDRLSPDPVEKVDAVEDRMLIRLNLQMKDSKSKTTLSIRKDEPMEKLMREFCRAAGKSFGTLKFSFDGESIELSATPQSLDLDTDYCIDVLKL